MERYVAKLHFREKEKVLAIADPDIAGKIFRDKQFKIEVSERFYGTNEVDEDEVKEMMKSMTIGNFVGKNSVSLAVREGYVLEKYILSIGGVPHAQFCEG